MCDRIPRLNAGPAFSFVVLPLLLAVTVISGVGCHPSTGDQAKPSRPNTEPIPEAKDQDIHSLGVAGYAKLLCSSVFVTGMNEVEAIEHSRRVVRALIRLPAADLPGLAEEIDYESRLVKATLGDSLTRTAKLYGDQGCIIHPADHDGIFFEPVPVQTSLPDGQTQPWPMGDALSDDPLPPEVDQEKVKAAVELAFEKPSRIEGMVVLYKGRLVAERYAEGITQDTLLESWSQGKSLTGTLIGRLEQEGLLKLEDPAPVPEWQQPGDERAQIRIADLMRMSSGLQYTLYEALVKTPEGQYEVGSEYPDHYYPYCGAIDVFRYVVSRPLQYPPNTVGRYRNCDPLTLGYIVKRIVQEQGGEYLTYPQRSLFDEIGIRRMVLDTDPYGNFVLSGYEHGTVRDWARIGLLYLQEGLWQGKRLLSQDFVDFVRTPAPAWNNEENKKSVARYGGMWWLNTTGNYDAPEDTYYAAGAGGQTTLVIPSRQIVVAKLTDYDDSIPGISKAKANAALKGILAAIGNSEQ